MAALKITSSSNGTASNVTEFNSTRTRNGGIEDGEGPEQYEETTALLIFRLVLFVLITAASLIGNSVIFKAVWSMPSRQRPFSYYLVANMAFAEILFSLCLPFVVAFDDNGFKFLENIICVLNPLQVLSLVVVTYSMAAIAFYRYKVFKNPLSNLMSRKLKTGIIFCLWLTPTLVCVPVFLGFKIENGKCDPQSVFSDKIQVVTSFILRFVVPYFVIVVSYGAVAGKLRTRIVSKTTVEEGSSVRGRLPTNVVLGDEDPIALQELAGKNETEEQNLGKHQSRSTVSDAKNRSCSAPENVDAEKDLLKMIYAIILVFVICYFPYQAFFLWEYIAEVDDWKFRHHSLLQKYLLILTYLPSALHPLLYGTMNRFYAKAFSKIFLCK